MKSHEMPVATETDERERARLINREVDLLISAGVKKNP